MQNQFKKYDDSFEKNLFKHCKEKQTGTILIATNNNKSCQITLEKGKIIAVSMGRIKGDDVARVLYKDGIKSASFSKSMSFPHSIEATINSSRKFLDNLKLTPHLTLVPNTGINLG